MEKTENILISEIKELRAAVRDLSVIVLSRMANTATITTKDSGRKLSVRQAAAEAGVSVNTVHNWIRAHKITVFDYGGKIVIERKTLNDFLEKSKVESIPDLIQHAIKNKK